MTTVSLNLHNTGYCTVFEAAAIIGGAWHNVQIPALFALIQHPTHGVILFDTGYSEAFHRVTQPLPERIYAWLTPTHVEQSAAQRIAALNIAPEAVRTIIISHFHADHICGLADFPDAKFVYNTAAYQPLQGVSRFDGVQKGFLRDLIPPDFEARSQPINFDNATPSPDLAPFTRTLDLFGDGSIRLIELSGHAIGQIGAVINTPDGEICLAADACWHSRDYRENNLPPPPGRTIIGDIAAYRDSLDKLHRFHHNHPDIPILPSHCPEVRAAWTE